MAENTPARIEDLVAARIRAQFVELIPEETFNLMVKKAINDFTNRKYDHQPSELEKIILEEIKTRFLNSVRVAMDGPEFQQKWNNGQPEPSEFIKSALQQLAPALVESMFAGLVHSAVNMMRNNLSRI